MNTRCHPPFAVVSAFSLCAFAILGCATSVHAQSAQKKGSPASKVYFSDVKGQAQINTGDLIEDLAQRSVYSAEGTVIETLPAESGGDTADLFSTMVYSNGTGAYFDTDTKVEITSFVQEPFVPNRTDGDVEPSISQTQAFVSRGTVGLCASKLVAGSNMNYATAHGSINIRGRRVVIEATPEFTKISMLEGESAVRAGSQDMGGHSLKAGQQAIIRPGAPGQPNIMQIIQTPEEETVKLNEKVAVACAAKKTVYFEVREVPITGDAVTESTAITAFDGDSATASKTVNDNVTREIVPVPVVPVNLPVQYTVSSATLPPQGSTTPGL